MQILLYANKKKLRIIYSISAINHPEFQFTIHKNQGICAPDLVFDPTLACWGFRS